MNIVYIKTCVWIFESLDESLCTSHSTHYLKFCESDNDQIVTLSETYIYSFIYLHNYKQTT